jgi:electron transport complex protein RnfB
MIVELVAMLAISLALGLSLAFASRKFLVKEDQKVEEIFEVLPHNNCGACGFPGCLAFAKAVSEDSSLAVHCRVGGAKVVERIGHILGVELKQEEPLIARVFCKGSQNCNDKFLYRGVQTCKAAALVSSGPKSCTKSCLGFGDCVNACQFAAITIRVDGLPAVNAKKCNGCGLCAQACPKNVLALTKRSQNTIVGCRSLAGPKENAKNCKFGCIACGICVKNCSSGAIKIDNNLAVVDFAKCAHCGLCAKVCPRKVIEIA